MAEYSITAGFLTWLAAKGYAAYTYPPKAAPDEFVTVERTGGGVSDMVDHPTIAVQTWALSEARAEQMANAIRFALVCGDLPLGVSKCSVNSGAYPFWDESTGMPRYQTVYDCTSQLTQ